MPDPLTPVQFAFMTRHLRIDGALLRSVFAVEEGPVSREDLRAMRTFADETDLDYTEFRALDDICNRLEVRLDALLGPADAARLPATASEQERQDLTRLAAEARDFLGNTRPEDALVRIEQAETLCQLIEQRRLDEIERLAREEKLRLRREREESELKALKEEIKREVREFRQDSDNFTQQEWSDVNKLATTALNAAEGSDPVAARKALVDFLRVMNAARENPPEKALLERFLAARETKRMPLIVKTYLDCVSRKMDLSKHIPYGFDRQVERFLNPPKLPTHFKKVDFRTGEPHARQRHTRRGIHAAGAVLTAHPSRVSIFADEGAFQDAKKKVPLERNRWTGGGDRIDAEVDGVHYQAIALDDTLSITSFYPVGGKDYAKTDVANLLRLPYLDFCDELDKL